MPYLTTYSLQMQGPNPPTIQEVATKLAQFARPTFHEDHYPKNKQGDNPQQILWEKTLEGDNASHWYNHQEEMAVVSMNWPGVLFQLTCTGEDTASDNWREYHLEGKVQLVFGEMTYPIFEVDKLDLPEIMEDKEEQQE